MTWPVGTAVRAELDALHAESAALRAERDESVARADRDVIERNRVIAEKSRELDEAVALLREARPIVSNRIIDHETRSGLPGNWWRELLSRIDAFLAKVTP